MRVSQKLTFNEYWSNPAYHDKRPVRNGSRKMMVGDNIYYYDPVHDQWHQADSHHSHADGTINPHNLEVDTQTDQVLISRHFFYFGVEAPIIPNHLLDSMGYKNGRNYRVFDHDICLGFLGWLHESFHDSLNAVHADPFDFEESEKRYSARDNKIA
jgi:hypothetical protein